MSDAVRELGDRSLLLTPRGREEAFPLGEAARILAEELGLLTADATSRLRYGGGFILERAPEERADAVRARFAEIGIETVTAPSEATLPTPTAIRLSSVGTQPEAFEGKTVTGRAFIVPWAQVRAIELDLIPSERSEPTAEGEKSSTSDRSLSRGARLESASARAGSRPGGLSPRAQRLLDRLEEASLLDAELRLSIHTSGPPRTFRLERQSLEHASRGRQRLPHSLDNFLLLLDEVVERANEASGRDAVLSFLRDLDPRPIVLAKPEESQRRARWIAYWFLGEEARHERWLEETKRGNASS